eukprot:1150444-Pelagomonas_calceolata.AAC.2
MRTLKAEGGWDVECASKHDAIQALIFAMMCFMLAELTEKTKTRGASTPKSQMQQSQVAVWEQAWQTTPLVGSSAMPQSIGRLIMPPSKHMVCKGSCTPVHL